MLELYFFMFLFFILINFLKFYVFMNLMFLISFSMLFYLNWMDWSFIMFNFGMNMYSYGLLILLIWVMSLIIMNFFNQTKMCLMLNLMLMLIMCLNFLSMNLLLFYFFFEIGVLLIFYMIIQWGYSVNRFLASFYLLFYTMMFSLPMLFILFYLYNFNGSLNFFMLEMKSFFLSNFTIMYLLMSFLVKIPMYLFHTWLLKAHVEASYFNSMILAAIMLKLGGYGLLRMIYIFNMKLNYNLMIFISLFGSLILSMICLLQVDMKVLVALSSVVHMSLMIVGMLIISKIGIFGSYLMMISHGLSSSGLFYLINIIYEKTSSRLFFINKGIIMFMPSMSLMWFLLCSSNMAAPFSLNLVSEIFLMMSILFWSKLLIFILLLYCTLSFIYSLYLFSFSQHGSTNMLMKLSNGKLLNYLVLILHWLPMNLMIFNLMII